MDHPTIQEALKGEQLCSSSCGYVHVIEDHEKEYAVDQIVERIERIEAHLGLSK